MRNDQRRKLSTLEGRVYRLQKKLQGLVAANDRLSSRALLLNSLVDSFAIIQANTTDPGACDSPRSGLLSSTELLKLREELPWCKQEQEQQLSGSDQLTDLKAKCQQSNNHALLLQDDEAVVRIAPRHDPMASLNALLTQAPPQEAETITPIELAAMHRDAVLQASALLVQRDFGLPAEVPVGIDQVAKLFHR